MLPSATQSPAHTHRFQAFSSGENCCRVATTSSLLRKHRGHHEAVDEVYPRSTFPLLLCPHKPSLPCARGGGPRSGGRVVAAMRRRRTSPLTNRKRFAERIACNSFGPVPTRERNGRTAFCHPEAAQQSAVEWISEGARSPRGGMFAPDFFVCNVTFFRRIAWQAPKSAFLLTKKAPEISVICLQINGVAVAKSPFARQRRA